MSAYDELICVMRQQGTAGAPEGILIGTKTGPTICDNLNWKKMISIFLNICSVQVQVKSAFRSHMRIRPPIWIR